MVSSNATFLLLLEVEVGDGGRTLRKQAEVGVHKVVADHVEGGRNNTARQLLFVRAVLMTHMVTRPQRG